jgi:indolepyruvate ferredoxin oxidoreductase
VFQNLGDGTYFHSGLLAIRAAVASGVNITYKILFNDGVAMTGGQPVDGELSVAQIVGQLRAEGVQRIAVVSDQPDSYRHTPWSELDGVSVTHRSQLESIQCELRDTEGCTALIYAQTCAALKRRRRKKGLMDDPAKRVFINDAVCEGCGDCGVQSNCLSIIPKQTALGRKRAIDQSACNKDYSCVRGFCPSFVTVHGGQLRKPQAISSTSTWAAPGEPQRISIDGPFNILITGIGGTGILTVGSILGMAAHIEQKGTSVLNQTGLAQKFGAVTGHVRIAENQQQIHSVRIPAGEAHLLLGADLVVAAADDALAKLNREHSHAVINSHLSPTADFTHDADAVFPINDMEQAIAGELESGHSHFVRATTLATRLLGDAIYANFFLLGVAYQRGLIPLSAAAIDEAIELNGVAIEQNQQAFLWGRRYSIDAAAVLAEAGLANEHKPTQAESLDEIIDYRSAYLVDYQDQAYAERYLRLVERVRKFEQELQQSTSTELPLTEAVAHSYFILLAYKDEYEVARLYTNGDFEQILAAQFEGNYRVRFHLAPPLLAKRDPHTGNPIKREFGGWVLPLFRLLAHFKNLRGGKLDIFGYTAERKMERALITAFEQDIDQLLDETRLDNLDTAIEIACLPQQVRGFGHVKQASIEKSATRREQLLQGFSVTESPGVEIFNP